MLNELAQSIQRECEDRLEHVQIEAARSHERRRLETQMADNRSRSGAFTDVQVANHLGLSPDTLRLWRRRRVGPRFVKIGRSARYLARDLEEYLAHRTVNTNEECVGVEVR
jgi:predicted DNA-binding transcriptional regulator AlpA